MNDGIENGGPAFPVCNVIVPPPGHYASATGNQEGMSLRDWFAGMALQATDAKRPEEIALQAYAFADAMLAERAKEKKE